MLKSWDSLIAGLADARWYAGGSDEIDPQLGGPYDDREPEAYVTECSVFAALRLRAAQGADKRLTMARTPSSAVVVRDQLTLIDRTIRADPFGVFRRRLPEPAAGRDSRNHDRRAYLDRAGIGATVHTRLEHGAGDRRRNDRWPGRTEYDYDAPRRRDPSRTTMKWEKDHALQR